MTVFWVVAALFVTGALLFLLPGLLAPQAFATGPDAAPGAAGATRPAKRSALALALVLPAASVGGYLLLGSPELAAPPDGASPQVVQQVRAQHDALRREPDHAPRWLALGRGYAALQRYGDAAIAYRRALALSPPDASLLADLADLVAMAQGKRLAGEPVALIRQALELDAAHPKALSLAGSAALEAGDAGSARALWERLLAVVPADSPQALSARGNIARAARLESTAGGLRTVAEARPAGTPTTPSAPGPSTEVAGQVIISAALAARVGPGDTLFIFARAVQGPRMPLAIVRRAAQGWPADFRLDDAMAMSPPLRLSAFDQVVIGARISRSGNATPQPGDLMGQSAPVRPGAQGVQVLIDGVQP